MKIAVVTVSFPNISETFVVRQIVGLIDQGHAVDVVATGSSVPGEMHETIRQYNLLAHTRYLPLIPKRFFRRVLKSIWFCTSNLGIRRGLGLIGKGIRRAGKEGFRLVFFAIPLANGRRPDVLLAKSGDVGLTMATVKRAGLIDCKLVTVFNGADLTRSVARDGTDLYKNLFEAGEFFLPVSEYFKTRLLDLGCPASKIEVHHMGVDLERFRFRPRLRNLHEPMRVLSVGRLVEKKGFEFGIRAVAAYLQKFSHESLSYTIVGDGPLRASLQNLADSLGVGRFVRFTGPKPEQDVAQYMSEAYVLLAPSVTAADGDQEGIPVVLMEAMARGLPVITTYHSGIPELVQNQKTGLLAEERDVISTAKHIAKIASADDEVALMTAAARTKVEEEFNIVEINTRLGVLLAELSSQPAF